MRRGCCNWRGRFLAKQAAQLEPAFLARLAEARSNVAAAGDGAKIYKEQVSTKQLGLEQVAAHYAISSVFSSFAEEIDLFCFRVWRDSYEAYSSGRGRLALGRVRLSVPLPASSRASLLPCCILAIRTLPRLLRPMSRRTRPPLRPFPNRPPEHVQRADFPEVIRLIDSYYGHVDYSLTSLFTDEQRRIVQIILSSTLAEIEKSLTTIYEDHASLLHYLSQAGLPKPPALTLAAGFAINAGLRRALEATPSTRPNCAPFYRWPRPTRFRWRRPRSPTSPTSA